MTRCVICRRRIWPWQHYGFLVKSWGEERWHRACKQHVEQHIATIYARQGRLVLRRMKEKA